MTTTKLETRRMGRTEMRPNSLALGAAWLWRKPDAEVIGAIRHGIELGINYIDTYPGHAEHLWGEALSDGLREKVYLQAKGRHTPRTIGKTFLQTAHAGASPIALKISARMYLDAVLIHDPLDMESVLAPGQAPWIRC